MIKEIFFSVFFLTTFSAQATGPLPSYYGIEKWDNSKALQSKLYLALSGGHLPQKNSPDKITSDCSKSSSELCFQHDPMSYKTARENLFGHLALAGTSLSTYSISTIYCDQTLTNKDLSHKSQLGPMKIPDERVLNAEHSWPQSKFNKQFDTFTQKGDLHILFPVLSVVNSIRGNHPYGNVVTPTNSPCPEAALGKSAEGITVFEPGDADKGNVARAVFYFSIRYKSPIDPAQESYLRAWHKMDPVDAAEMERNENIYSLQKNRNPFIDAPELVEEIDNF
jgi:deoxyribonuclease I